MNRYLEKCLPYLRRPFANLPNLHCHPYTWPASNSQPLTSTNGWGRVHYFFNCSLIIIYAVFVCCRTGQVYVDPDESLPNKFYMLLASQFYGTGAIFHIAVMSCRKGLASFFGRYIGFLKTGKRTTMGIAFHTAFHFNAGIPLIKENTLRSFC